MYFAVAARCLVVKNASILCSKSLVYLTGVYILGHRICNTSEALLAVGQVFFRAYLLSFASLIAHLGLKGGK